MMTKLDNTLGSILFLSHGGGPLPILGDESHSELIDFLGLVPSRLIKPEAIVVVSAHWEEANPSITNGKNPGVIYDYYGFPKESYEITYPAPGDPALAKAIGQKMTTNGFSPTLNGERGFDHGLFVPLKLMYPEASIPCIQISLLGNLNPVDHIKLGQTLANLDKDNILIIGSGFSFHNLNAFFAPPSSEADSANKAFENWLSDVCLSDRFTEEDRTRFLVEWESAPGASFCHPREEHLLPLHVCYGAAGKKAKERFEMKVMGKQASAFLW